MRFALALALVAAFAASCRSGLPGYERERKTQSETLENALSYLEDFEGGGSWKVPSSRTRERLDYKSTLRIAPDRDQLLAAGRAQPAADVLGPLSGDETAGLDALAQAVSAARAYVAAARAADEAVAKAGPSPSAKQITELQAQIAAQGAMGDAIVSAAMALATADARASGLTDADEVAIDVDRRMTPLLTNPDGTDTVFNVDAYGEFLAAHVDAFRARANADALAVETKESKGFRVRALLYRSDSDAPVAVHVENYDDIEGGQVVKSPRLGLNLSPNDAERLRKEYEVHRQLVSAIRDLGSKDSELRKSWAALRQTLKDELHAIDWKDLGDQRLAAVKSAVDAALQNDAQLQPLADFVAQLQAFAAAVRDVRTLLDSGDPIAALPVLATGLQNLGKLRTSLEWFAAHRAELGGLVTKLAQVAANALANDAALKKIVEQELAGTLAKVADLKATLEGKYPDLFALIESTLKSRKLAADVTAIDPNIRVVPIDNAQTGSIDLGTTPADSGDQLQVIAELVAPDATGEMKAYETYSKNFEIERLGWSDSKTADMVLVDRIGNGVTGDPDTHFDPFASVSWTLHYRVRPQPGAFWSNLQDFFDLGAGLNAATLDFEDDNVQIGIGVHLSFFHDLLLVGRGRNLNASHDDDYNYVGIGLLQLLGAFNRSGDVNSK